LETLKKYVLFTHPVVSLCLCVGLLFAFRAYESEREARIKVEATIDAQKGMLAHQDQIIKDAQQAIKDRDTATAKTVDALARVQAQPPASPVETAGQIAKYLALAAPPAVAQPGGPAPAPGSVVFTPPAAEELRKASVGCAEDQVKLTACQKDAIDRANQTSALEDKLKVVTGERDAAVKAIKGGSFFTRLKHDGKTALIGAGVAIALNELVRAHAKH